MKEIEPSTYTAGNYYNRLAVTRATDDLVAAFMITHREFAAFLTKTGLDGSYLRQRLLDENQTEIIWSCKPLAEFMDRTNGRAADKLRILLPSQITHLTVQGLRSLGKLPEDFGQSQFIDWLLGVKEPAENEGQLATRHSQEQYQYEATPYYLVQKTFDILRPGSQDILYDLGSGYGKLLLFVALTTDCGKCKGIELVHERVAITKKAARALLLPQVEFIEGNVLDSDFSDGTMFFLFNPFCDETLEKVGEKFKAMASQKRFKIVNWGGQSVAYLKRQPWLKRTYSWVKELNRPFSWGIHIFESQK